MRWLLLLVLVSSGCTTHFHYHVHPRPSDTADRVLDQVIEDLQESTDETIVEP